MAEGPAEELTISLSEPGHRGGEPRQKNTALRLGASLWRKTGRSTEAYRVKYATSAVLVRSNGTIGSPVLEGADAHKRAPSRLRGVGERRPGGPDVVFC